MKYIIVLIICISLVTVACVSQKVVEYKPKMLDSMSEDFKAQTILDFKRGKSVYTVSSCAGCHNKTVKGKIVEPVFTLEQLSIYKIRAKNVTHSENLSLDQLSEDDFDIIMFYLMNKKSAR